MKKVCSKCKVEKSEEQFHRRFSIVGKVKRMSWCRDCHSKYCKGYREKNRMRIRKYQIGYAKLRRKFDYKKISAREKVSYAIKSGKLKKEPCEDCGEKIVEAHHEDYSKPLRVRWYCKKHHEQVHWE